MTMTKNITRTRHLNFLIEIFGAILKKKNNKIFCIIYILLAVID